MKRTHAGSIARVLAVAGLLLLPGVARAQVDFGVRGGVYSGDRDGGFIGAELLTRITRDWFFNPNVEYVFADDGSLTTINLDAHYDFRTTTAPFYFWAGGGPAVLLSRTDAPSSCRSCRSESKTNLGLDLLAGMGFGNQRAPVRPYVQGKLVLSSTNEAVLAFGLRFY
jgi:hypothetical protein